MPSAKKRREMERAAHRKQLRLWGIVGAALLALVVLAIVLSQGEGSDTAPGQVQPVTVAGQALPAAVAGTEDGAIGMEAPTLEGRTFDGTPVTIDPGSSGRPTAIWFVAHWCHFCNNEVPRIVSLSEQGAFPAGLDVYAVSTSADPKAPNYPPAEWLQRQRWPFPVLADDELATAGVAYGQPSFPFLVVADADGRVVYRHAGELGEEGILQVLQQAVA